MCLLTVIEPNAETPEDRWHEAALSNPDGFGFALHLGNDILRFRSMAFRDAWQAWCDARDRWPDRWAVWHWRYATGGGIRREMAHPFRWGTDSRLVIAHNGVLPIAATPTQSDTARLADRLGDLSPAVLDSAGFMADLGEWATGSKLAMLSAHPDTRHDVYIVNEDAGHWEGGVWYSNRSYLPYTPARLWPPRRPLPLGAPITAGEWRSADAMDCGVCSAVFLVPAGEEDTVCPDCHSCWLCDEHESACECWEDSPEWEHPDASALVDEWDTGAAYR